MERRVGTHVSWLTSVIGVRSDGRSESTVLHDGVVVRSFLRCLRFEELIGLALMYHRRSRRGLRASVHLGLLTKEIGNGPRDLGEVHRSILLLQDLRGMRDVVRELKDNR